MPVMRWMQRRLKAAKDSLHEYGIPRTAMRSRIELKTRQTCRACVDSGVIYAAKWWAERCYNEDDEEEVERWLRHELAHVICDRYDAVVDGFDIPEYPSEVQWYIQRAKTLLAGKPYGDTHPEEKFAENVADLDRKTMRKLAKILK